MIPKPNQKQLKTVAEKEKWEELDIQRAELNEVCPTVQAKYELI